MNKWKRLLSVVLTLSMMLSWNVPAYAAEGGTDAHVDSCAPGEHVFTDKLVETINEPTCTDEGVGLFECDVCGQSNIADKEFWVTIPATGHDLEQETIEPTCTSKGQIISNCKKCDYTNTVEFGELSEHVWATEKTEKSAATCESDQIMAFKCTKCTAFQEGSEEETPDTQLEHDYSGDTVVVQAATCILPEKTAQKCVNGCEQPNPEATVGSVDSTKHNYEGQELEEKSPATCGAAAVWAIKCKDCGEFDPDTEEARGEPNSDAHVVTDQPEKTMAATCLTPSYKYQECKNCGTPVKKTGSDGTELDAENHEWAEEATDVPGEEATCQKGKGTAHFCKNPAHSTVHDTVVYDENKNPENHTNLVKIPAVPATCAGPGKSEGEKCADCNTVTLEPQEVSGTSTSHVYPEDPYDAEYLVSIVREPDCSSTNGLGKYKCVNCGNTGYKAILSGHKWGNATWNPEVSCTDDGVKTESCTRTDKEGNPACTDPKEDGSPAERTTTVPAKGHTWSDTPDPDSSITPNCHTLGKNVYKCTVDGCSGTKEEILDMTDHDLANATYGIIEANCQGAARVGWICGTAGCGAEVTGEGKDPSVVIPDANDDGYADFVTAQVAAFIANNGYNETDNESEITAFEQALTAAEATAHNGVAFEDETHQNVPATCTEDGTTYKKCQACGEIYSEVATATGHSYSTNTTDNSLIYEKTDATCTEDAVYKAYCKKCKQEVTLSDEELTTNNITKETKTGHEYQPQEATEATCIAEGHGAGNYCAKCETWETQPEIYPIDTTNGHNWETSSVLTEANCNQGGLEKQVCSICKKSKYVPVPVKHNWGEMEVTKPATCTEDGEGERECQDCHTVETGAKIEKLGHDMQPDTENSKPATCGADGVEATKCSRCDHTETKALTERPDHTYTFDVKEADCGNPAKVGKYCSVCGDGKDALMTIVLDSSTGTLSDADTETLTSAYKAYLGVADDQELSQEQETAFGEIMAAIMALTETEANGNHTYVADPDQSTPKTCTEDGAEVSLCSTCGKSKTVVIPKGHELEDKFTEANCENAATVQEVCTVEGCGYTGELIELADDYPALDHDWQLTESFRPATCTETGLGTFTCSRCDKKKYEAIPTELGHKYDAGVITTEVTCTTDGVKTYTCSVCEETVAGHTKTEIIEHEGHKFGELDIVPADCTHNTTVGKQCSVCKEFDEGYQEVTTLNSAEILNEMIEANGWGDGSHDTEIAALAAKLENPQAKGHEWTNAEHADGNVEVKAATCTENGTKTWHCLRTGCDGTKEETIEATGHNLTVTQVASTCFKDGYIHEECANCDYDEETALPEEAQDPAHHVYGEGVKLTVTGVEATTPELLKDICENGGTLVETCTRCTEEEAAAAGDTQRVKRTAIAAGHDYKTKLIRDEAGKLKVSFNECTRCGNTELIYVAPHYGYCPEHGLISNESAEADALIEEGKEASCTEKGYTEKITCLKDHTLADGSTGPKVVREKEDIEMLPHKFGTYEVLKAETCATDGQKQAVCAVCSNKYGEVETIPSTGEHNYLPKYTPANCTNPEILEFICDGCGGADPDQTPVIGEDAKPDAHVIEDNACKFCHKTVEELGWHKCETHGWAAGKQVAKVEATCTTAGHEAGLVCPTEGCNTVFDGMQEIAINADAHHFVEGTCEYCNKTAEELGFKECATHGWVKAKSVEKVEATCTTPGHQAGLVCPEEGCDNVLGGMEEIAIDPDAHNLVEGTCEYCNKTAEELGFKECTTHGWVKAESVAKVEATCTTAGREAGLVCPTEGCDTVFDGMEEIAINPDAHSIVDGACEYCHKTLEEIGLLTCPVHGEVIGKSVEKVDATCTEAGHEAGKVCPEEGCTEVLQGCEVIEAKGHTEVTLEGKEATCTEDGLTAGVKCSVCETILTEQEVIPATGHTPGEYRTVTESTCETAGSEIQTCAVCGEDIEGTDRELELAAHTPGAYRTVKASTCMTEGSEIQTCSVCEKDIEGTDRALELDADNHEDLVTVPGKPATCTETGLSDGEKCEACGVVVTEQTEIEALGHKFDENGVCTECGKKTASASTVGSGSIIDGNKKITLSTYVDVEDKDAEIIETGMLYINAAGYDPANVEADLSVELNEEGSFTASGNLRNRKFTKEMAEAEGKTMRDYLGMTMTLNLGSAESTVNDERMVYARGYVITLKDGVYTITYSSNIISGNYANGFN